NEPAYILATSGTTAKPKLAVHTHGGYQVYVYSMGKWMFGLGPTDIWWSTSDIGWVVGHSYIVFGPLLVGCTTIAYEGALDHPNAETFYFVIERPFPGLTARLWAEPERYARDYWEKVPGKNVYFTGDATSIDSDGYVWFSGRADEIIKIADHRIGTIEVETAFLRHPAVTEAGVTGRPDELRGQVISAFVVLKQGREPSDELKKELLATVRNDLGPLAVIGELNFVDMLPKTRSGKIMRRVLK